MNTLTFEMGISDHHKLIGTVLRSTFADLHLYNKKLWETTINLYDKNPS